MKIKMMKTALGIAVATLFCNAAQASTPGPSAELTVSGKYTPGACVVKLANSGTIDYGRISQSSLNKDALTQLPVKTLANALTVTCESPTILGFVSNMDNRTGTQNPETGSSDVTGFGNTDKYLPLPDVSGPDSVGGYGSEHSNGLGLDSKGNKIGSYISQFNNIKADEVTVGVSGQSGFSDDKLRYVHNFYPMGASGSPEGGANWLGYDDDVAIKASVFVMDYSVSTNIAPTSTLDFSQDIILDGSVTVTLMYL